ncbi:MAG TPA: RNA polymerase subunit sigma-24 [Verrucomicrobiales bacterium]|nr:RNA polymerase subunit sigma-24 [Verrucomicrobiales bacterium]
MRCPVDPAGTNPIAAGQAQFRTTHWSLVIRAANSTDLDCQAALERLCRTYWPAVCAFVARRGHSPEDAKDLTQGFFAQLLEKRWLKAADMEKGRFRTFLLTAVTRFLSHERDRNSALKRGGGGGLLSLDACEEGAAWMGEPATAGTAEEVFDRPWAESLLNRVLSRLRSEYEGGGRSERYEELKRFLTGDAGECSYAGAAERLGITESAVKSGVHRLRTRYAELVREEIAETVDDPADVPAEIRYLAAVLGS